MGNDVYIPKDLSQDHLPCSYRYYDPIIQMILDAIDDERKEYFHSKNLAKYMTTRLLPTEKLKDDLLNNKGPTFG